MKINKLLSLTALIALAASCGKNGDFKETESGLKYKIHTKNQGEKPKEGDWITLHVAYKTDKDSVFFDTHKYPKPIKVPLMKPSYKGSFEEGLALLGAGDSATFLVSADSVFKKVFMAPELPPFIKKGSTMKIEVKILDIETKAEVDADVKQQMEKRQSQEAEDLAGYLAENKITAKPLPSGLILMIKSEGKGAKVMNGQQVEIHYTGKFLNGQTFDSSVQRGAPIEFKAGSGQMIPAWEEAIPMMKVGSKATLIAPSKLAYGERGISDGQSGKFIIAPFTPLVFEIEVISAK